jgi:hypothetical protein
MISDVSGIEAKTLLDKLITESVKVEAWFVGSAVDAHVCGILRLNPDGQYCVSETETSGAHLSVNASNFAAGKYADKSSVPDFSPPRRLTDTAVLSSALMFKLKDGSIFTLFEIAKAN